MSDDGFDDEDDKRRIKLVVVGDGAVGKTCLLVTFATGKFPEDYVPTVFDNQITEKEHNGEQILVQLWDTAGQEDYDRLRPLSYPGTDVLLLCYSTVSEASFEAVTEKWLEEVKEYIEDVPIFLVGTKTDMRDDKIADIVESEFTPISFEDGQALADEIGALKFIETSAKTEYNLDELFHQAIQLAIEHKFKNTAPPPVEVKKEDSKKDSSSKKKEDTEDKESKSGSKTKKTKKKKWWSRSKQTVK